MYFAATVFVGASFGYGREAAILSLLLYIAWSMYRLSLLEQWVHKSRRGRVQENTLGGIWGEIAEDVKLLARRYEKDKARLQTVVTRVQEMTSALHDGVLLADKRANIEWWNQAAVEMLNLREIDLGHRITNILRDPRFQTYYDKEQYGEPLIVESFRGRETQLMFQVHPFGQGERLIVIRDITRVAKLEQMRRDFVANVSHELRTPLTVIRGYVETLLDTPDLSPTLERALEQMKQQGLRMTALVSDLITLTKLETDDRTQQQDQVNLHILVNLILSDAKDLGKNQHQFFNTVDESLILRGCEKEIRSAISNLVFNAVKYSPENTEIRVSADMHGTLLHLDIHDNGTGIDPKHIPRLTERFYRVDSGRAAHMGGTGLGLAIVKHVMLRHDGLLKIHSKLGKGSTFSCCFPSSRVNAVLPGKAG